MVDHDGVIHYSPNVPAFLKAPLRERLEADAIGLPTIVDNDANVAAWPSSRTAWHAESARCS